MEKYINNNRPGWLERISYGLGGVGLRLTVSVTGSFLLMYYTNVAFLDIAAVSVIMAVSRFFDGVSDLVIGRTIDNTKSKIGKARAWLLRMCLPLALSMLLMFWVPENFPAMVKYIYVFLTYNLVNSVCFTFMQISHLSLISFMSDDSKEHALLGDIQGLARNIGILIGSSFFVKLLNLFTNEPGNQNTQRAYTLAVTALCIVMIILTLITVVFTRERVCDGELKKENKEGGFRKTIEVFLILLKDRRWIVIIICELLTLLAIQSMMSGVAYFSMYVLGDMDSVAWLMAGLTVPGIVIQLITPLLLPRFGKNRLYVAGLILSVAGLLCFGLSMPNVALMKPGMFVFGAGRGLTLGMMFGLIADIVTSTRDETGHFIAGIGNAGIAAVDKIGIGLGSALFGIILAAAGFDAALDAQGIAQAASVVSATSFMFVWFPMVLHAAALIIFVLFFDMHKNV